MLPGQRVHHRRPGFGYSSDPMTTTAPRSPGTYHSRSRVTRKRVLLAAAGLALVLVGYTIGRLQGGSSSPAVAAPLPPVSSPSALAPTSESPPPSVEPSPTVEEPKGGTDAYSTIQAENSTNQQGTESQDTEDDDGGKNIGWINSGDWLQFDQVNFSGTPATQFAARVASDVGDGVQGRIELRIDSLGGTPIGTITVGNMGGWQKWQTMTTGITPTTGMHTLYVTFASDSGTEFLNLNYFAFSH